MVWIIVAAALAVIYFGACFFASSKFVEILSHPRKHSYEEVLSNEAQMRLMDKAAYDAVPKKDFSVQSSRGYTLQGRILLQPDWEKSEKKKVIVLCHGWTSNSVEVCGYYKIYYDKGFNCVLYDHRYHGHSGGDFCSMGYYEHKDLEEVCVYARTVFGNDCILGIMGESMGAATVMLATPEIPNLAFTVEDCGYSSLEDEIVYVGTKKYHVPKWPVREWVIAMMKKRMGYDVNDVRPMDAVARSENVPMLFVHGDNDHFVPSKMMMECYNKKKGFRMCRYFEGSEHARSHMDHPAEYEKTVWEFLEKIGVI
ncbi:MAG: alpha/beta hydrolase [Sphaerochaetaceae bacterium]|nr:alpha/beta hydrolase [Sphaerochaetaceae bacterium]MDD4396182.1 alpha/beta hydrolase [Sphaerochaetaceae bacterium]